MNRNGPQATDSFDVLSQKSQRARSQPEVISRNREPAVVSESENGNENEPVYILVPADEGHSYLESESAPASASKGRTAYEGYIKGYILPNVLFDYNTGDSCELFVLWIIQLLNVVGACPDAEEFHKQYVSLTLAKQQRWVMS